MINILTSRFSKKLILVGIAILVLSFTISMLTLWNVYGIAGNLDNSGTSGLSFWQLVANFNKILVVAGYLVTAAGILFFILSKLRRK